MNWQIIDFRLKQSSIDEARKSISILLTILVGTGPTTVSSSFVLRWSRTNQGSSSAHKLGLLKIPPNMGSNTTHCSSDSN